MDQSQLYELFSSLHDNLGNPEFCNSKIEECMNRGSKDVDELVHIMCALRPIKDKLTLWESYIQYCRETFNELRENPEDLIYE